MMRNSRDWIHKAGPAVQPEDPFAPVGQLMWIPEIARAITRRCTSDVPSKIV